MNDAVDRRREARALTQAEASALIASARNRGIESASVNRGGKAKLSLATLNNLRWRGEARAMLYELMLGSGLRLNEALTLSVGDVVLEGIPHITIKPANEKAKRGASIPISSGLAAHLRSFISERVNREKLVPITGQAGLKLFDALGDGRSLLRQFDKDLVQAGVEKKDDFGRIAHLHGLRHSYGTWLSQARVPLAEIQRLMRHSDPGITMKRYVHLGLIDLAGAVESLPSMTPSNEQAASVANDDSGAYSRAHCNMGKLGQNMTQLGESVTDDHDGEEMKKAHTIRAFCDDKDGSGGRIRTADLWVMR